MSDPFGDKDRFSGRPDHPDFWKLSEVILRLDGAFQEVEEEAREALWEEEVGRFIDPEVVGYVAFQRAVRVMGITMAGEVDEHAATLTPLIQCWVDAFMMGCNYQEKHGSR